MSKLEFRTLADTPLERPRCGNCLNGTPWELKLERRKGISPYVVMVSIHCLKCGVWSEYYEIEKLSKEGVADSS